jgi:acetyl/propionyl-CoA carboxylase alpha subunit
MVTRQDLVHWQIRIARGERLSIDPDQALVPHGHAIECRIYAEDPDEGFLPSPGLVRAIRPSAGPGIRDDGGVIPGYTVPIFYDSMIAKLIAWSGSRADAVARMLRALQEYEVLGVRTTIPFFLWLLREPDFLVGRFDTTYLDRLLASRRGTSFSEFSEADEQTIAIAAALDAMFRASAIGNGASRHGGRSGWTMAGRQEALR